MPKILKSKSLKSVICLHGIPYEVFNINFKSLKIRLFFVTNIIFINFFKFIMSFNIVIKYKENYKADFIFNKTIFDCYVGYNGIGKKTREGDKKTPKGIFRINYILYRQDKINLLKCNFKKIPISQSTIWSVDSKDIKYNQIRKKPCSFKHETMFRNDSCYDLVVVLDYNVNTAKKFKGSAIFLHCKEKNKNFTDGCIAVNKNELIETLKLLPKSCKIIIK